MFFFQLCVQPHAFVTIFSTYPALRQWLLTPAAFHDHWSPLHIIAEMHGESLVTLLRALPVPEVMQLLSICNTATKMPVAYMFANKQTEPFMHLLAEQPLLLVNVSCFFSDVIKILTLQIE